MSADHRPVLTEPRPSERSRARRWLLTITAVCGAELIIAIALGAGAAALISREAAMILGLLLATAAATVYGRRRRTTSPS